jgi:hypothetical protein
MHATPRHNAL